MSLKGRSRKMNAAGALIERLECRQLLSAGSLDGSFGGFGGTEGANRAIVTEYGTAMRQPAGAIVVSARTSANDYTLHRFTPDGRLDTTLGSKGSASVGSQSQFVDASAMASFASSGMVIGGVGVVGRLTGSGRLVKSFGSRGTKSVDLTISAIAVQRDGKILLWGASITDPSRTELLRLFPGGKPDSAFGQAGVVVVSFSDLGAGTQPNSVTILPNGKIVVAGTQADQEAQTERAVVARFGPDGRLDSTLATGGIDLLPDIFPSADLAKVSANVAVQPDGSFLAVYDGSQSNGPAVPVRVYRFTSSGAVDLSFGTMGFTDLPNAPIGAATGPLCGRTTRSSWSAATLPPPLFLF